MVVASLCTPLSEFLSYYYLGDVPFQVICWLRPCIHTYGYLCVENIHLELSIDSVHIDVLSIFSFSKTTFFSLTVMLIRFPRRLYKVFLFKLFLLSFPQRMDLSCESIYSHLLFSLLLLLYPDILKFIFMILPLMVSYEDMYFLNQLWIIPLLSFLLKLQYLLLDYFVHFFIHSILRLPIAFFKHGRLLQSFFFILSLGPEQTALSYSFHYHSFLLCLALTCQLRFCATILITRSWLFFYIYQWSCGS